MFLFQGGASQGPSAFRRFARLARGAYCYFDAASARQLRELLAAVAVYATGGRKACKTTVRRRRAAPRCDASSNNPPYARAHGTVVYVEGTLRLRASRLVRNRRCAPGPWKWSLMMMPAAWRAGESRDTRETWSYPAEGQLRGDRTVRAAPSTRGAGGCLPSGGS